MRLLKTNTAIRLTVGPFLDKTDGITPEVALTVTSCKLTLMVDTADVPTLILDVAPTASGGANDMVHVTNDDAGFYDLELAAANVNYLGRAMLAITDAATHCPVFHEFMILPAMVYDSIVLGTDTLQADVAQWLGTAAATPTVAGVPEVDLTHVAGATTNVSALATNVDAILTDTAVIGAAGAGLTAVPWNAAWDAEVESEVDDALGGGTGTALTAIPWNASWDAEVQSEVQDALDATLADSVPADGTRPSIAQALYMITQFLYERSVSGTTVTVKKVDGSTSLLTLTISDATSPTSITRAT